MNTKSTAINRDMTLLCPLFAERLAASLDACNASGYQIRLFEGYRSPQRQDWLYGQGRTRGGKIVTKAKAWQSWHQFGLAADVAKHSGGKWSWDFDPGKVAPYFLERGLEWSGRFEQCHFQMTGKMKLAKARQIALEDGPEALWAMIR